MCQFFSAIVTRQGKLFYNKFTHSHENIIRLNNLIEGIQHDNFVRVEYIPQNNEFWNLDNYKLKIDENIVPNWFNETIQNNIILELDNVLKSMIIIDSAVDLLCGDCYILHNTKINIILNCIIYSMSGNSVVNKMYGNSVVNNMSENSVVNNMSGNSVVRNMYGNSVVNNMSENSVVNK